MNADFNKFMEEKDVAVQTKRMYKVNYNKFDGFGNLLTNNQNAIIDYINDFDKELEKKVVPNTKLSMNSFVITYRRHFGKTVNKLINHRKDLELLASQRKTQINEQNLSTLPTINQLKQHERQLYRNGDWLGFIIVNLLRTMNVRNQDLNLRIQTGGYIYRNGKMKDETDRNNYLIMRRGDSELVYIRNHYKTFDTYGSKIKLITSKKLKSAVLNLVDERGMEVSDEPIYLFSKQGTNEPLDETGYANVIKSKTLNNLSQVQYNKIITTDAMERKDYKLIKKIASQRGTDLTTLMESYGLEFPQN